MGNLLSANFSRLWKDKLFWIGMAVMAGFQAFELSMLYLDGIRYQITNHLESVLYIYGVIGILVMSVFCSMFLGTEYSDGTMRNKLVVGHKRSHIYLANLLVCAAAGVLFALANLLVSLCVGIPMFGLAVPAMEIFSHVLVSLLMVLALAAIFTLIGMLCHSKAFTVAISILMVFGFLMAGMVIKQCLMAPEMQSQYVWDESIEEFRETEPMPNPKYLRGFKRKVYEFFDEFLPGGQMISNSRMMDDSGNDKMLAVYDAVWIAVTVWGGIVIFKRKDLK